jgi:hypothetical protein
MTHNAKATIPTATMPVEEIAARLSTTTPRKLRIVLARGAAPAASGRIQ